MMTPRHRRALSSKLEYSTPHLRSARAADRVRQRSAGHKRGALPAGRARPGARRRHRHRGTLAVCLFTHTHARRHTRTHTHTRTRTRTRTRTHTHASSSYPTHRSLPPGHCTVTRAQNLHITSGFGSFHHPNPTAGTRSAMRIDPSAFCSRARVLPARSRGMGMKSLAAQRANRAADRVLVWHSTTDDEHRERSK